MCTSGHLRRVCSAAVCAVGQTRIPKIYIIYIALYRVHTHTHTHTHIYSIYFILLYYSVRVCVCVCTISRETNGVYIYNAVRKKRDRRKNKNPVCKVLVKLICSIGVTIIHPSFVGRVMCNTYIYIIWSERPICNTNKTSHYYYHHSRRLQIYVIHPASRSVVGYGARVGC